MGLSSCGSVFVGVPVYPSSGLRVRSCTAACMRESSSMPLWLVLNSNR
jgi:hypothetical protein